MSTIPTIFLPRKSEKRFILDGQELVMSFDARTINHFQKITKRGFLKVMDKLKGQEERGEYDLETYLKLLGSCIKYPDGRSVGVKFLNKYDEFMVVHELMPMFMELMQRNLPEAKDESEKK